MTRDDSPYLLGGAEAETRRLARQAEFYGGAGFVEPLLAPLRDKGDCGVLDVGSGSGHIARHVARSLPAARVVGIDIDASRLAFAREHVGAPNLDFQRGSFHALPFADHSFDLVYTRFVLIHDRDPAQGLREMARVTRPGGLVVAYDMIHEGVWYSPPKPAFQQLLGQLVELLRERGAEPNQGLHLPVQMERAGLEEVRAQVIPHAALGHEALFEAHRENWLETIASLEQILEARFDAALLREARREVEARDEAQFVVEITVLATGRKPAG